MNTIDTQNWLLNTSTDETLTYQVFEDNAGNLSMLIYTEDAEKASLIGACLGIMPEDIKTCIEDLDMWHTWGGLVDVKDFEKDLDQIRDFCALVEGTRVESLGLIRVTNWDRMGEAAKQAFKYRAGEIFGGRHDAPAYAEPILKDYLSGRVPARCSSTTLRSWVSSFPVFRLEFKRNGILYSYEEPIAKIDRKNHALIIKAKRYSRSTSRIQNAVVALAEKWGFTVVYASPSVVLKEVLA